MLELRGKIRGVKNRTGRQCNRMWNYELVAFWINRFPKYKNDKS